MKKIRIVWIAIFIIGFGVRSTELLHPIDTNEWREVDESSIARNYYRNGMDFSHPQVDWGGRGEGYTESEFPAYPYLIATSYKIFGIWDQTGRIISFLFSIASLIIFFRLSSYLFNQRTAIVVSAFFALNPLLMATSNAIRPESMMFFFYILCVYSFIHWIDSQSDNDYILTIVFTATAILCKLTAINIGILYASIIIVRNGWKFVFKPKVILLGILCILPAAVWYIYSHGLYVRYGNSLGLSNEYPWVGWDFFTNHYFIKGISLLELIHVWSYSGLFIFFLALVSTELIRKQYLLFPIVWLLAAGIFYIVAARTTADNWAYYYHIFSVPSASMLMGISVLEIYDKYFPLRKPVLGKSSDILSFIKNSLVITVSFLLIFFYAGYGLKYFMRTKPNIYKTSAFYASKNSLSGLIPKGTLILASGGDCKDKDNYRLAYNASYFFYWLDRKGYNICTGDQSLEKVKAFKEKGAKFYIAEKEAMKQMDGFEDTMRKNFKIEFEGNGIVLFRL